MKIRTIKYLQQGGPMPAEAPMDSAMAAGAPAEAPTQGQDQMVAQLEQIAMEIIQSVGPEGAAMLAEIIMAILQQGAQAPAQEPVFKKGGKIARR